MTSLTSLMFCYCILSSIESTRGARIVFIPYFSRSRYLSMKWLGQELAKRGHQATVLVDSGSEFNPAEDIQHAVYTIPYRKGFYEKDFASILINAGSISEVFLGEKSIVKLMVRSCEALLKDTKLLDSFKGFDLIVTDVAFLCGPIVADYLNIRRIDLARLKSLPWSISVYESLFSISHVPQLYTQNPTKMNFRQRLHNTLAYFVMMAMKGLKDRLFQDLKMKYKIKPHRSYLESCKDKELTLISADFVYECPQPLRPDYKLVGPLNIQPVKPLPPDLQQLIDSSGDDGAIIVSFGSNVASVLNKEKVDIMAEAFGRLKQKVIWRLKGYIPSTLSSNIKVVDWMPQNDLLANEKLRAFVTHAGVNSVYDTLYRGVPVVAMPLFYDQFDNASQAKEKGFALIVDYKTLTADDLYEKIQRVINVEPSFRKNAQRISRLLSDRSRTPAQEAGDWIEYTLRHESLAHLRPYSSQLAWYQYFLVDVSVFLVLVVLVVILVIKYTLRLMCWMCCRPTKKLKAE